MSQPQVIYKRTATGAIQEWWQEIGPGGDRYRTVSGQQDGEKVEAEWTICEPKNVGRANATNPQQQCLLEVAANYAKKLAQGGYHETIATIDTPKFFKPMLAELYEDYPVTNLALKQGLIFDQPKLDGIRCINQDTGAWSRNGKPIPAIPHIVEILERQMVDFPETILDGELYNHDFKDDFNAISSIARKLKPTSEQIATAAKMMQYHVYDLPSHEGGFEWRTEALQNLVARINHPQLVFVETTKVTDLDHLEELHDRHMDRGYEGQIVRRAGADYENKRTKNLLKRKSWIDEEYVVVDIEEGKGNWAGKAKRVFFEINGEEFKATMTGTMAYCAKVLAEKHKYIGGEATVKRSKNLTPRGVPRWGTVKTLHGGKREL